MALVYITDDEPSIRRLVAFGLRDAGCRGAEFVDGTSLLAAMRQKRPDAVILDWIMSPPDGLAVCRILRESPEGKHLPILMLTAKGEEFNRVPRLEVGVDDYIVRPFSMKELAARVRAVLHRSGHVAQDIEEEVFTDGGLTVDIACHTVARNGELRELMAEEFDLLVILMKHRGRVMTHSALLDKVWGVEYYGNTHTMDIHVRYPRQKIEKDPESPRLVQTVRDVGCKFTEQG